MIWLLVLVHVVIVALIAWFAYQAGIATSDIKHTTAMINHHGRMLGILEEDRLPHYGEVTYSLDLMRYEVTGNEAYLDRLHP